MDFIKKFLKFQQSSPDTPLCDEHALLLYNSVNDVIQAESVLKKDGFEDIKVVAPPPRYRTGCDLAIRFPLIEQVGIMRSLGAQHLDPENVVIVDEETLRPTEIYAVKDFGEHIMVRAANMKLTFDKKNLRIVNISGGGCSDVPYLAHKMIGTTLKEAPSPRNIGFTLCAYTLDLALDEARKRFL